MRARGFVRWLIDDPDRVRADLEHGTDPSVRWRRALVVSSLVGMAAMVPPLLRQTGLVRHLPDPPGNFDSDKVNLSDAAFRYGMPDAATAIAGQAANIALAGIGAARRAERHPWLPLGACAKAAGEAAFAVAALFQMPRETKAWCPYCIVGATSMLATFAFTVPEALAAARHLRRSAAS